ncbi:MAG TPA: bifunctional diaminohydroxyphosphoribosylaminopyrimidine deaminase/5-amino-6-(5-phosphoribosylamino)uracil reductase RibD [Gammaproteobacteria bacterium]|nr:bifunctional diaminohydroxyphosphoribosylaminopyrimidine deaminase/5-amino-6-(5-phosphoribosylamino)uracil reductase RibD [Gammaproteobacteria bacterium]
MSKISHEHYLLMALAEAKQRRGFCAPNPAVGAVVVKDGIVLAMGFHWAAGFAHAEVDALNKLSLEESCGATVYVTLEPCCHQGRTPPCTQLLIERKVAAVYYGYQDPNPLVASQGEQQLRMAGIFCQHLPVQEINAFYQSYDYWTRTKLPFVTAKLALSLDGKIAGAHGQPVSITGLEAQKFTHQGRRNSDAILTTSNTIIHDDPQLNVRIKPQPEAKPVYILDTHLKLPLSAKILTTAVSVTVFHQSEIDSQRLLALEACGVRCVPIPTKNAKLPLVAILRQIGADGVHDLWVEAGGICFQALLAEDLIHRAYIYIGLKWLGESAQAAFLGQINLMQSATKVAWRALGSDGLCELEFVGSSLKHSL